MKKQPFRPKSSYLITVSLLLLFVALMGISVVVAQDAQPTSTPNTGAGNPALANALAQSGAQISYHKNMGTARFITSTPGRPIAQPAALRVGATGEEAARGFLAVYGSLFGINNQAAELMRENEKKPDNTRTFERFQQVYNGIPIIGGELIVQMDKNNNILSANGETLPKIALSTTPTISAANAVQNALNLIAKYHDLQASDLTASTPILSIYNPALIGPNAGVTQLVWRTEVTQVGLGEIREFVLVDALRGGVVLHFNQLDAALSRQVYTANHTSTLPGVLLCSEGNSACGGDEDAQAAYTNAGATYNYYFSHFGRNSINNAGMVIKSTVHYRSGFDNAFWYGSQMVYGDERTYSQALDIVAHELTHGVTQYESGLFYYYQSGAINESLSDVFGELVQQDQPGFSGTPWLIGEDLNPSFTNGFLRNMADPTQDADPIYGFPPDPDKMTSPHYEFDPLFLDNGGVHENSGINNKAAYLMAAGGTFNGHTVTALGNDKTAKIYYEAQTNLITSGTDYGDLYDILYRACFNVLGGALNITVADCQEVRDATDAVEMNLQPITDAANPETPFNPEASLCPAGQYPDTIAFTDNLEQGAGNWNFGTITGTSRWSFDSIYGAYAHSGLHFLYADDFPPTVDTSYVSMKNSIIVPPNAYLHFAHAYQFEAPNYDGGVVEYSIDNVNWNGTSTLFITNGLDGGNGYTGIIPSIIPSIYGNPLRNQKAFVGISNGYVSSRINLAPMAGQSIRFRWRIGLDEGGLGGLLTSGWWLDDVMIYNCGTPPANDNFADASTIPSPLPYSLTQTMGAASLETVEQKGACETSANILKSVWYKYSATAHQKVAFSVTGSTFVKSMSVWTGSMVGALTQVGCATGANAVTTVDTTNGALYYVRVGSSKGAEGDFTIQVGKPPANDDFANAIVVNNDFTPLIDATRDVIGATLETGEPTATCGGSAFRTIWYKYTSLGNNTLSLNTTGSDYDTVLSVWTGAGLGALTQVASGCNDNAPGVTTSALTLTTTPGAIYYIRVGSKGGSLTSLTFNATTASVAGLAPLPNYFTTGTPTLTWNRVTDATQYEVQVSKSSTFTTLVFPAVIVPSSQLSIAIGTDTPNPLPEGVYYWRVRAIRGAVVGTFSAFDSFVVDLP